MATLQGKQINNTYPGLIKTNDESALDPTVTKKLQDGSGNDTTISLSQASAEFDGIIDLSSAAVVGGLFQMDVPNQIIKTRGVSTPQIAINLSTVDNSIFQPSPQTIGIGFDATSTGDAVLIGRFGSANDRSTVVGFNSYANGLNSGIFGYGNGIQGIGTSNENFILGHTNLVPDGINNVHIIGNNITADESDVVMTNKPIKATGFKTTTYGEVIDNAGNWTGNPIVSGVQSVVAGTNVTVDNTDPANPVVSATGGGGGSDPILPPYKSMTPWDFAYGTVTYGDNWNYPFDLIADNFQGRQITENTIWFIPITLTPGTVLNDVMLEVTGAKTVNQGTVVAVYDSIIVSNKLRINQALASAAFDASTTGVKILTGLNVTAVDSPEGIYWLAIANLDTAGGFSIRTQANNNFGGQYVSGSKFAFVPTPASLNTGYTRGTYLLAGGYGGAPQFNLTLPTTYDYVNDPIIRGSDAQNDLRDAPLVFWK